MNTLEEAIRFDELSKRKLDVRNVILYNDDEIGLQFYGTDKMILIDRTSFDIRYYEAKRKAVKNENNT